MRTILTHRDLKVHKTALQVAHVCACLANRFPEFESDLKRQLRRAARAPGACVAEAWRKRNYQGYWSNKLSDGIAEAGEAQWWLEVALTHDYCNQDEFDTTFAEIERLIAQLATMIQQKEQWTFTK